jgi:alkylation response protein AidB-like acyl-CoA dehydrogenase
VKAQTGRILSECAQCAVLLFGGKGYTKTGQGELVERMYFSPLDFIIDAYLIRTLS